MLEIMRQIPMRVSTWEEVKDIIYGKDPAGRTIVSGSEIEIKLKDGTKHVLQFTRDDNGNPFFVFKDGVFKYPFGDSACWKDSTVRKELKNFFDDLPEDLQEVIKPVTTRQYFHGEWIETEDKLFIPSVRQVFGWCNIEESQEESQFEIFKDRKNRCKDVVDSGDRVPTSWWLRSAFNYYNIGYVYTNGDDSSTSAISTYAVCPSFSI